MTARLGKHLGKHDYSWFAEEDLLREVPKPPLLTRLCLNWSQCKQEEPLISTAATTTTTTISTSSEIPKSTKTETTPSTSSKFKTCSGCGAKYCCRECQVEDWKGGHKKLCKSLKTLRTDPATFSTTNRRPIIEKIIHEHRIYMCPFAVCKYNTQGRGFLLITSIDNPINDFIYKRNVDMNGMLLDRRIELEYLDNKVLLLKNTGLVNNQLIIIPDKGLKLKQSIGKLYIILKLDLSNINKDDLYIKYQPLNNILTTDNSLISETITDTSETYEEFCE